MTGPGRTSGKRRPDPEAMSLASAVGFLCVLYALLILFPASRFTGTTRPETITLNDWRGPLYLLALATSATTVFLALRFLRRRGQRSGWIAFAIGASSPLFLCVGVGNDLGAFMDAGSVRDVDGTEYHLLESAFLQGSELAIGRLRRRSGPIEEFEVLVDSPWEEHFGFLSIVRSQDASRDRRMYLTKESVLVGVPYGNKAFLGYDLGNRKAYSQIFNANEEGYADMRKLSPFLLLGAEDAPRESDVRTLFDPKSTGRPFPEAIARDRESPNHEVAELTRRLLHDLHLHPYER